MARSLLRFLLKSKNQISIRIDNETRSTHGRLLLDDNGYSIMFETSDNSLENMDIVCSSNEQGIEQLVISLSVIKGWRISSGDERPLYKYGIKYIRYCDSLHTLSKEWNPVSVKLTYPQVLHSMFLSSQYPDLRDVNCGKGLVLTAQPTDSVDNFTGFTPYRSRLSIISNDGSIIERNTLYQTITRVSAIITALGYRPIDCQEVQICSLTDDCSKLEKEKHTNHLIFPTMPMYGASNFGPYQDVKLGSIRLRYAFDHFMERDLTPILYWRVCCIFGSKDDLFTENILNQQFICLDSLVSISKATESDCGEINKLISYLKEQKPAKEQVSKSMLNFLKKKGFRMAYLNRGGFERNIRELFYPNKKEKDLLEQQQRFIKVAHSLRNALAHGKMLEWPNNIFKDDEHAAFAKWLYSNTHIAVLNYLNRNGLIKPTSQETNE